MPAPLMREINHPRVLLVGFLFSLTLELLDVITTQLGMFHALCEGNPLFADPNTCRFITSLALQGKAIYLLVTQLLPALFLYAGTRSPLIASVPFWYQGTRLLRAIMSNIVLMLG